MHYQKEGNRNKTKQLTEQTAHAKKVRAAAGQDMEETLLIWLRQLRYENIPIDGVILVERFFCLFNENQTSHLIHLVLIG